MKVKEQSERPDKLKKTKKSEKYDAEDLLTNSDSELPKKQRLFLLAQEIKFAKYLAGNDVRFSDKQLKKLKKWLKLRSQSNYPLEFDDLLRLWKGLFYCMWMSDKPLVQEDLTEEIASIIECLSKTSESIVFYGAFLKVMALEWFGIDQWRIDKFMMLVRRMTRKMFIVLHKKGWKKKDVKQFNELTSTNLLFNYEKSNGLFMHYIDLFLDELAKSTKGEIPSDIVSLLLDPFITVYATMTDVKLNRHLQSSIFYHLMSQSDLGREYREKFDAWKSFGFKGKSIDELECVELEEEQGDIHLIHGDGVKDDCQKNGDALDPRAGRVSVLIPEIKFEANQIVDLLNNARGLEHTTSRTRRGLKQLVSKFSDFAKGVFPLGFKRINIDEEETKPINFEEKTSEMVNYENDLLVDDRLLKKLNKRKRKRLLGSIQATTEEEFEKELKERLQQYIPNKQKRLMDMIEEDVVDNDDAKVPKSPVNSHKLINKGKQNGECDASVSLMNGNSQKNLKTSEKKLKNVYHEINSFTENDIEEDIDHDVKPSSSNNKTKFKNDNYTHESPKTKVKCLNGGNDASIKRSQINPKEDKQITKSSDSGKKTKVKGFDKRKSLPNPVVKITPVKVPSQFLSNDGSVRLTPMSESKDMRYNPYSKVNVTGTTTKKTHRSKIEKSGNSKSLPVTPTSGEKKVVIALHNNQFQTTHQYIQKLRESPQVPFDSKLKPTKGLLKPNSMPSPINPFYRKKLGFNLDDTM